MSDSAPDPLDGSGAGRGSLPEHLDGPMDGPGAGTRPGARLPAVLAAVFAAGLLGTAARLAIDLLLPVEPGGIPLSTILINTAGSFVLGVLVAAVPLTAPEWLRTGLTTGLLGSFTTFSALTVAAVALAGSGNLLSAVALIAVSVGAGVAAALAGIALGSALLRRRA